MRMPDDGVRAKLSGAIEDVAVTIVEVCRELGQKEIVLKDCFFADPSQCSGTEMKMGYGDRNDAKLASQNRF